MRIEPVLEELFKVAQCPIFFVDKNNEILFKKVPRGGIDLSLDDKYRFLQEINSLRSRGNNILLFENKIAIGGACLFDQSVLLIGPLSANSSDNTKDASSSYLQEVIELNKQNNTRYKSHALVKQEEINKRLANQRMAINALLKTIAWFCNRRAIPNIPLPKEFNPMSIKEGLGDLKHLAPDWSDVVLSEEPHNSYSYELAILDAVTQGDIESYLRQYRNNMQGLNGTIAYSELRSAQNLAICQVVLCSRAAILGGLNVEMAYTLADYFILIIEKCDTLEQASYIDQYCGVVFAKLVKQLKSKALQEKQTSILTQRALQVIRRYLFVKTNRHKIAKELGLTADYVDRVLKKDLNSTISSYLKKERLEAAKQMLLTSNKSLLEISELLLFSNISHFSILFKQAYGISPRDFRKMNQAFATR